MKRPKSGRSWLGFSLTAGLLLIALPARAEEPPLPPAPAEQPANPEDQPAESTPAVVETPGVIDASAPDPQAKLPAEEAVSTADQPKRPWSAGAVLNQSLGIGAFVSDPYARSTSYGWAFILFGSYRLSDLFQINGRTSFDQQLSITNQDPDSGTSRAVYWRETRLGIGTTGLYKEPITGIGLDATAGIGLPTDRAARAAERWVGVSAGITLTRNFEKLGPGDLKLLLNSGLRRNFGPGARSISQDEDPSRWAACGDPNRDPNGDCKTSYANPIYAINTGLSATYTFFEKFDLSVALTLLQNFGAPLASSPDPVGLIVRHSPNAVDHVNESDVLIGSIALGYAVTENFSVTLALFTAADPYRQIDANNRGLRFPFFDFVSTADNLTSYSFGLSYNY